MSATLYTRKYAFTVNDTEHLPDHMAPDDVADELSAVVDEAIAKWYRERGHELLRCEPST